MPNLVYTFTRNGIPPARSPLNFSVGGSATFTTDYTQIWRGGIYRHERQQVNFGGREHNRHHMIDPTATTQYNHYNGGPDLNNRHGLQRCQPGRGHRHDQ